jgi:hypothetical protein
LTVRSINKTLIKYVTETRENIDQTHPKRMGDTETPEAIREDEKDEGRQADECGLETNTADGCEVPSASGELEPSAERE